MTTAGSKRRELRRRLGTVAWCALEDLGEVARFDALGRRVAVTSVRQVAANLGVSKDTAARALRQLRSAGLVEALSPRREGTGRFGHAAYLLAASAGVEPTPEATIRRRTRGPVVLEQASLFDAAAVGTGAGGADEREAREQETRRPETRGPQAREPETRNAEGRAADDGDGDGRGADAGAADGRGADAGAAGADADDGEAAHTLAPCGAVGSPAGAGDSRAGGVSGC